MFNVFTYEKKLALDENLKKMKENFVKDEFRRKARQEKLVNNYKKKIENFVLQMSDKPIVTHDMSPYVYKIREEDTSKFLGPANMVIRSFKHEKDRIQEAIEKNKEYRNDGSSKPFEFRKRQTEKEIQPQMHFTTKSNLERVAERIEAAMSTHSLYNESNSKGQIHITDGLLAELSRSPQMMNQYLAKNVMPEMHLKTHFKAAQTLAFSQTPIKEDKGKRGPANKNNKNLQMSLGSPNNFDVDPFTKNIDGFKISKMRDDESRERLSKISKQSASLKPRNESPSPIGFEEENNQEPKLAEKHSQVEVIDPTEVSKKILLACNIIKTKSPKVRNLKKGQGHLMSMSGSSVGEIYNSIYRTPFDPRASI